MDLKKLMVDEESNILPCFKGNPVGVVGDSLEDIKGNIHSVFKRTKADKGCAECEIQDECSQCIFTGQIRLKEYCRIMKEKKVALTGFVKRVELNVSLPRLKSIKLGQF